MAALVPLSVLRLYINAGPSTSTEANDLLTSLEAQAVGVLSGLTGWDIEGAAAATDYYNGTGTNVLVLRGVPDTSATFTVSTLLNSTWDEVDSDDYQVLIEGGGARARLLHVNGGWPQGELNVKVLSTRGYTSTTCPKLLQRAILDLVSLWYRTRVTAQPTASAEGEAGNRAGWPDSVQAWLDASKATQEAVLLPPLARM